MELGLIIAFIVAAAVMVKKEMANSKLSFFILFLTFLNESQLKSQH
ncbi:hypothetical protein A79_0231 [Vibrio parahaemolyticus AQ3810]|nr:hypothetical protein A79_0231 [Vibrio parahaemolyticus AQ3810]